MPLQVFLAIGAVLFCVGIVIIIVKKNAIMVLIGIELIFNAANINLVAFSQYDKNLQGQVFALFVMVVAAAETAVALAIILKLYQLYKTSNLDEV